MLPHRAEVKLIRETLKASMASILERASEGGSSAAAVRMLTY